MSRPIVHYRITQAEQRVKHDDNADYDERPMCGCGDAHAKMTRRVELVTCRACMGLLLQRPAWLYICRKPACLMVRPKL